MGVGSASVMTAMSDSSAMATMERRRATYSRIWRRERKGMWRAMSCIGPSTLDAGRSVGGDVPRFSMRCDEAVQLSIVYTTV